MRARGGEAGQRRVSERDSIYADPAELRYAMRSARSSGFFRPANTILVPGMYFFGSRRYAKRCWLSHTIPAGMGEEHGGQMQRRAAASDHPHEERRVSA
jgi:hypothetical protein